MGDREGSVEVVELMSILENLTETYKDKTVLITGHTGFKGGWLALWLESLGAEVIGYSLRPPTVPSFFEATGLTDKIVDIHGDILDRNKFFRIMKKYHPDFVFHLAAQALVRQSYNEPAETFSTNIMGTINVLESIRLSKNPTTCVCVTSDKCYENREWVYSYRENDPLGGHDPYSASKGAAELVIASYRRSFFNPKESDPVVSISSTRAGNVIGGGDWGEDRIVPDCIRALIKGSPVLIRNPHSIRPWQFVLEPLYGYLLLAQKMHQSPGKYEDAWNFGPFRTNVLDVQTLTEKFLKDWGGGTLEISSDEAGAPHEATYLSLDVSKAITRLGWKPVYDIDNGLRKTVEWYRRFYTRSTDLTDFSRSQINDYYSDFK